MSAPTIAAGPRVKIGSGTEDEQELVEHIATYGAACVGCQTSIAAPPDGHLVNGHLVRATNPADENDTVTVLLCAPCTRPDRARPVLEAKLQEEQVERVLRRGEKTFARYQGRSLSVSRLRRREQAREERTRRSLAAGLTCQCGALAQCYDCGEKLLCMHGNWDEEGYRPNCCGTCHEPVTCGSCGEPLLCPQGHNGYPADPAGQDEAGGPVPPPA